MNDPFVYSYVIGGAIFLIGLLFAARQGFVGLRGRGLVRLIACCGVIGYFASIQGWLQYAPMNETPAQPYTGGADHILDKKEGEMRGTALDYGIMVGYFVMILLVGTWFGRKKQTTKDFFFGGQRFSWWLISFSLVATTVGSYSFVKYSNMGFKYGLSSSQTYMNDWIWFPLLAFGWLPILYFSRVTTVPEYFERRFNAKVRFAATVCILIYLVGYVGVNLFTMGKVLNALLGWPIPVSALLIALISMTYVTAGGQTSVIMTDLLQGVMLLVTGCVILFLGVDYVGGFGVFWDNLPRGHRQAFANFNEDPKFPSVGIFWQDGIANTAMLYFLNQGIIMRFLAARSLRESRKAALVTVVGLMSVAAVVVAAGGWVAAALVNHGDLPEGIKSDQAFYIATDLLSRPGVFGLVLAALTAALMSTVDTLITAVAALTVNDVYKRHLRPEATDAQMLRVARVASVGVALIGVILVPVFMGFDSIYAAHGAFTASVTPPLVVTLLLSVFWRRFTAKAALMTLIGGLLAMALSIVFPHVITPFAHGVPIPLGEDGSEASGMKVYKFMRAFYGITVCLGIGVMVTLFTKPESKERQRGLVWGTVSDALRRYKGSPGTEHGSVRSKALPFVVKETPSERRGEGRLPVVTLSEGVRKRLGASLGDLLYISDSRWWLGGLRSAHVIVGDAPSDKAEDAIGLHRDVYDSVVTTRRAELKILVEKLY
ncbi:MAG: sodium:solute symporter family protein [Verrucomicrobiales bacterium]|jgi:SSS family solute:Na+ symporter|nr:sodium:solute symporter family protein [bacterium]MDF1788825.1 sodium:solute symporter family protein [Verrucomicrobiales bacterium]